MPDSPSSELIAKLRELLPAPLEGKRFWSQAELDAEEALNRLEEQLLAAESEIKRLRRLFGMKAESV